MTTWLLYQGGYDLGKFYALEEFYAEDLEIYYDALVTHSNYNYYFGRVEADITPWLDYFLKGMSVVFERVSEEVERHSKGEAGDKNLELLRPLDYRARRVLALFAEQDFIKSSDVAYLLAISTRQAREILSQWADQGWLVIVDPSKRGRKYRLANKYQDII